MSLTTKLQAEPPIPDGGKGKLYVKVHRQGMPPTPWIWAIYREGHVLPWRMARHMYQSAEEAWKVGCAMLLRLGRSVN